MRKLIHKLFGVHFWIYEGSIAFQGRYNLGNGYLGEEQTFYTNPRRSCKYCDKYEYEFNGRWA